MNLVRLLQKAVAEADKARLLQQGLVARGEQQALHLLLLLQNALHA